MNNRLVWRAISLKTAHEQLAKSTYAFLVEHFPEGRFAMCKHPAEDTTPDHWHIAGSFASPVDCRFIRDSWMERDLHSYSDSGRSFNRCVRYLAHLDCPQKVHIEVSEVKHDGAWAEGEFESMMHLPPDYNKIATIISSDELASASPLEVLSRLMSEGFMPRDVSGYCQALDSVIRLKQGLRNVKC